MRARCWSWGQPGVRERSTLPRSRPRPSGRGAIFAVIHVSGSRDYAALRERLDSAPTPTATTLLEYEPDMGDGIAASDLALARSGASVFELAALGRAAVLVPYPYATGDHQTANAKWMADAGAAVIVPDSNWARSACWAK